MMAVHGTAIALGDAGALLRGPSGSGKSDLALRLIAAGARLVADDQVGLIAADGALFAAAPPNLAGLIEMHGVGIVRVPYRDVVRVCLLVDLCAGITERLPVPRAEYLLDIALPVIMLDPFHAAAAAKLTLLLRPDTRHFAPDSLLAPAASTKTAHD